MLARTMKHAEDLLAPQSPAERVTLVALLQRID
jgi:hypothetical protein